MQVFIETLFLPEFVSNRHIVWTLQKESLYIPSSQVQIGTNVDPMLF